MDVARFSLLKLARVARTDMLSAMNQLPDSPLARPRFGVPLLVVQDPVIAHQVLVADDGSFRKPWIVRNIIVEALGHTLFTVDGDECLRRRKPVAPVFGLQNIEGLAMIMANTVRSEIESWRPGPADDMQDAMTNLTLRVACQGLLGTDPARDELGVQVRRAFTGILAWTTHRFSHPTSLPAVVPTARNRAMKAARSELRSAVQSLIADRRGRAVDSFDVIGQLLTAQRAGTDITDEAIVDECIGFLFAGHETTAATLTWALYELATHPDVQRTVAAEGDTLTKETTQYFKASEGLRATSGVAEEVLRLYPAGISIARSARKTTTIGGHRVRRGTMVLIAVYRIQRAPAIGPNPNEFDPTRSLNIDDDTGRRLAFGLGPRRCLGARFARTEPRLAPAMICSQWELSYQLPSPPTATISPAFTVAGGLPLRLKRRAPNGAGQ